MGLSGPGGIPTGAAPSPHRLLGAWDPRRAPGALQRAALLQGSHFGARRGKGNRCLRLLQGAMNPLTAGTLRRADGASSRSWVLVMGSPWRSVPAPCPGRACAAVMGAQGSCGAGGCSHPLPCGWAPRHCCCPGQWHRQKLRCWSVPAPRRAEVEPWSPQGSRWWWLCMAMGMWLGSACPALQGFAFHHRQKTGPCLHLGWAAPALSGWTRTGALLLRAPGCFSLIQQDLSQFYCPAVCWRLTSPTGNQSNQRHSPSPCQPLRLGCGGVCFGASPLRPQSRAGRGVGRGASALGGWWDPPDGMLEVLCEPDLSWTIPASHQMHPSWSIPTPGIPGWSGMGERPRCR
ncbi:uncharacterized protein LOC133280183 [Pezoporus flaviventris]|uniref:uncharacterized protein LOC133280183 n=1 Tax=Pezoporus flaviventris TaxID=889875 RepID=UPI002AB121EC|nr:uncharacterized protein LOC133280183 [Pezoporus flaviventris]